MSPSSFLSFFLFLPRRLAVSCNAKARWVEAEFFCVPIPWLATRWMVAGSGVRRLGMRGSDETKRLLFDLRFQVGQSGPAFRHSRHEKGFVGVRFGEAEVKICSNLALPGKLIVLHLREYPFCVSGVRVALGFIGHAT